jgi:hypothetical protein
MPKFTFTAATTVITVTAKKPIIFFFIVNILIDKTCRKDNMKYSFVSHNIVANLSTLCGGFGHKIILVSFTDERRMNNIEKNQS